ncbi:DUF4870 domain-containing protein [Tessaracoccus sp. MC1865]|uniref:DUF4870 domain-containing protein n=1 Tax=Tessaracoccus sp. MC1865 TaxID=2760310 RepID=UPI0016004C94|nr:DUF4870 domain-containing protein [Tessaracoccus sp. MC1865]MBB1483482.1 DUF4870 domain-containing protein [Tessaracoccus sp. MC1865]QTO36579.1 DUF4870 domain-containing protein [Tessaracoccus sp. MC1865]
MTYHYSDAPAARSDERSMAVLAHLSAIIAMVLSAGWLSFAGPLIVWFLYKDRSGYVRRAAAGSFNFNIWAWLMNAIAWVCLFTVVLIPVSIVLWAIAGIMTLWCHIHGAVRASDGRPYDYPASVRILS